ncbi:tRNA-uridine aminocarboxypropyltransferase [Cobetia amphilecti]|uniref:tRNA-uridine aminocarboxypropyltransferase n=1 Tax=Cobetia amphilecti TaxID=1055104 RepID=UPI0009FE0326|nr:DTW domain-containing protein [Cobetia amphilecti]
MCDSRPPPADGDDIAACAPQSASAVASSVDGDAVAIDTVAPGEGSGITTLPSGEPEAWHGRHPRREFKARGSQVIRCEACRLPRLNCLCPYQVTAESRIKFWLITHPLEHYKPTNTGRLISDVLAGTEVFSWYRVEPDPRLLALLEDERYQPFIIFPDDQPDYADRVVDVNAIAGVGADVATHTASGEARIPVFILLDGTWRQARRIFRKSPYLDGLPVLPLHTQRLTRYHLRKPASEAHLCTAEVAAELLRQAGEENAASVLDDYFDAFNDCYRASRIHYVLEPTAPMRRLLARRDATTGEP